MNSGDRSFVACFITACLLAGFIVFSLWSCDLQTKRMNLPVDVIAAKSEHMQKMACITGRGVWVSRDDDGRAPMVCKFK